jgi:hypothetical protein
VTGRASDSYTHSKDKGAGVETQKFLKSHRFKAGDSKYPANRFIGVACPMPKNSGSVANDPWRLAPPKKYKE